MVISNNNKSNINSVFCPVLVIFNNHNSNINGESTRSARKQAGRLRRGPVRCSGAAGFTIVSFGIAFPLCSYLTQENINGP